MALHCVCVIDTIEVETRHGAVTYIRYVSTHSHSFSHFHTENLCISEKLDLGADVNCAVLASISRSWGERRGDREDSHRQTNTASALDRGRGGGHRNDSEAGHGHGRGLGRAVAGKMNKTKYFRLQLYDSKYRKTA